MKVGFTGTQRGMTLRQKLSFNKELVGNHTSEFHHGLDDGSDKDAHYEIRLNFPKIRIVGHPPLNQHHISDRTRDCDELRTPKEYLVRNHDIVDETFALIATPRTMNEELRSGTWATIRYARKLKRLIVIIYPDGTVHKEGRF